jgi:O-antigen/teichoic acid export membrane protein
VFRLSTRVSTRGALSASRGHWRSVTRIGLPVVIGQLGFSCGTIALNAAGAATAAAVFAVSVRLVTGINQLTGAIATALFPHLASQRLDAKPDLRGVRVGARVLIILSFGAAAVLMFRPALITSVLLTHEAPTAEAAAIFTVATSCATGFVVLFTLVMLARNAERAFLSVFGTATAVILIGAVGVAASPAPRAAAMAYVFGAGQLAGMAVLARHVLKRIPSEAATVRRTAGAAIALAALGLTAATVPDARTTTAAVTATCAALLALGPVTRRRRYALPAEGVAG